MTIPVLRYLCPFAVDISIYKDEDQLKELEKKKKQQEREKAKEDKKKKV